MGRHLILTVHGIGEQKPGETVDAIVGAATTRFVVPAKTKDAKPEVRQTEPVDIHRDLIELAEEQFDGTPRNANLFPVHLRRVRRAGWITNYSDTVFAEVFWADKSPAPKGPFWTMFDLLRVILGLGYIAMDNVENCRGKIVGTWVHAFTWLIFGVIAPLNAALLIGVGLLAVELAGFEILPAQVLSLLAVQGFICYVVGLYLRWEPNEKLRTATPYLLRVFGTGLAIIGGIIMALAFLQFVWPNWVEGIANTIWASPLKAVFTYISPSWIPSACPFDQIPPLETDLFDQRQTNLIKSLGCMVPGFIWFLGLFWFLTVACAFLCYPLSWFSQVSDVVRAEWDQRKAGVPSSWKQRLIALTDNREIYPSICACMVLFWLTVTASFWLALERIILRFSGSSEPISGDASSHDHALRSVPHHILSDQLQEGLKSLPIVASMVIVVICVAILLLVARRIGRATLHNASPLIGRVILNMPIRIALFAGLFCLSYAVLLIAFSDGKGGEATLSSTGEIIRETEWAIFTLTEQYKGWISLGLIGLASGIYYFSNHIAGALGIVRDIVSYAQADRCRLYNDDPIKRYKNFGLRNQIDNRFKRVFHYALQTVRPTRVTIIAHSQGTVIATQMLKTKFIKDRLAEFGNPPVHLVTMGSPVTHVYEHYFPKDFTIELSEMPADFTWHNIFRVDDFVGTRIDRLIDENENFPVDAGGHTGYFTDHQVWKRLYEDVGFKLL